MSIAGIDVGTTGSKCTIYSRDGRFLGDAYEEYTEICSDELDGQMVWNCVKHVLGKAAQQAGEPVEAIGVTSFGETAILLDENDAPVCPSILYTSPKGDRECEILTEKLGKEYICHVTGVAPHSMYSVPKLMWVSTQAPDIFARAKRICLFSDYIVYMLSGVHQIDYSLAARTMALDVTKLQWDEKILKCAGIPMELMPKIVPTGTKAGVIRPAVAAELGLSESAVIVTGCHDQVGAAVGTGTLKKGMAVDGTGTVECITPVYGSEVLQDKLYDHGYAIIPYLDSERYVTYAFSFTGGALLKWYRDAIAAEEAKAAKARGESVYDYFNSKVKPGPSGLLVLPHFAGAATPYMDTEAKGMMVGLTTETRSEDIYKALMEGVTFEMRVNKELLEEAGIRVDSLLATGGGARSALWLQMKADILNVPIVSLGEAQSGTLGCIMLSGVACGMYESLEAAAEVFIQKAAEYTPDPEAHAAYEVWFKRYKKLYKAMKEIYA